MRQRLLPSAAASGCARVPPWRHTLLLELTMVAVQLPPAARQHEGRRGRLGQSPTRRQLLDRAAAAFDHKLPLQILRVKPYVCNGSRRITPHFRCAAPAEGVGGGVGVSGRWLSNRLRERLTCRGYPGIDRSQSNSIDPAAQSQRAAATRSSQNRRRCSSSGSRHRATCQLTLA
jgi:hypothetical protein